MVSDENRSLEFYTLSPRFPKEVVYEAQNFISFSITTNKYNHTLCIPKVAQSRFAQTLSYLSQPLRAARSLTAAINLVSERARVRFSRRGRMEMKTTVRRARNSFRRCFDGDLMQPRAGVSSGSVARVRLSRASKHRLHNGRTESEKRRGAF